MKLLIELPTWLGDSVMVSPAIENLANYYNKPEITLIGSFLSIEIYKNHPNVVKTFVFNKKYVFLYKTAKDLGVFDAFFSFRSSFRSKLFKFFVSSNNKYQFNKNQYQNRHQVEKYNDFVNSCQNTNFPAGRITIHRNDLVINDGFKLTLGINPGASYGSSKRWYPEEFVKVATKLSSQYNIVIFGGTEEIDIANDIEQLLIKKGVDNYQNLAGRTTVSELIENISQLDLFITGDSGPMHVAAAFQVPTLAIFGPTKDEETGQWMNERSAIVKTDLNCQPCMKRTCPLKHHNCMKLIKSEDVIQAINNLNTKNLQ